MLLMLSAASPVSELTIGWPPPRSSPDTPTYLLRPDTTATPWESRNACTGPKRRPAPTVAVALSALSERDWKRCRLIVMPSGPTPAKPGLGLWPPDWTANLACSLAMTCRLTATCAGCSGVRKHAAGSWQLVDLESKYQCRSLREGMPTNYCLVGRCSRMCWFWDRRSCSAGWTAAFGMPLGIVTSPAEPSLPR